jgi:CarboxypepD_reg-like domain
MARRNGILEKMMPKSILSFLLLFAIFCASATAQVQVEGQVVDVKTGKPVSFVSIGLKNASNGTITNENGEFVLKVRTLPVVVVTSHLSYQTTEATLSKNDGNRINLTEAAHNLPEVRVSNLAEKLLKEAFAKNWKNRKNWVYGNAFYRQTTKTGNDYTELHEVFYAAKLSAGEVGGLKMQQARYAKVKSTEENPAFEFKNLSYAIWGFSTKAQTTKAGSNRFIIPVRANVADYYDLSINDVVMTDGKEIYEIAFTPKTNAPTAVYCLGKVFVNRKTNNVLKIEGEVIGNFLDSKRSENGKLTFDYRFKELPQGFSVLDYGQANFTAQLTVGTKPTVSSQATVLLYETDESLKKLRFRKLDVDREDFEEILKIKYDPAFWRNNPVIKRTAAEERVIKLFDGKNAFGTALDE